MRDERTRVCLSAAYERVIHLKSIIPVLTHSALVICTMSIRPDMGLSTSTLLSKNFKLDHTEVVQADSIN